MYLLKALVDKYKCKIIGYENFELLNYKKRNFFENLKWFFGSKFGLKTFNIYKSIGVKSFLKIKKKESKNIERIISIEICKIHNLNELEKYKFRNILIGDLIYDSYLKKYLLPTIDIKSIQFRTYFAEFIKNFIYWLEYFNKKKIKAVIASHGVYSLAIPLRIAQKKKINSYVLNEEKIYNLKYTPIKKYVSPTSLFQETEFYKKIFNTKNSMEKQNILKVGKKILTKRLKENFTYSYIRKKNKKLSKNKKKIHSNKTGVLIAAHSFFDSPHVYGRNFFPDFFAWLDFLTKLSKYTNYQWYIKAHPNKFDLTDKVIKQLLKKNKHIKILPDYYDLKKIRQMNIQAILTVYGSIAKEAYLYNIVPINASNSNPYRNFSFALTPKNIKDFKNKINNLLKAKRDFFSKKRANICLKDLFIYYYMDTEYFNKNYLFDNFENYIFSKKSRMEIFKDKFYFDCIYGVHKLNYSSIIKRLSNFINSKDYVLSRKHVIDVR